MVDSDDFGAELIDFRKRVDELRATRALPGGAGPATLDAALSELQYVTDDLVPRFERLTALASGSRTGRAPDDAREQRLLRTLFQRLPVAAVLLDRESVVSRLNAPPGRPLTASLTHGTRAALRSQVAAVARGEGDRSLAVELLRGLGTGADGTGRVWVTLSALRVPGQRRPAVLAVFLPRRDARPDGTMVAAPPLPVPLPGPRRPLPDPEAAAGQAALLDLADAVTTALLTAVREPRGAPLVRAAEVLRERCADWVIADLVTGDGGPLRRVTVLAPPAEAGDDNGAGDGEEAGGSPAQWPAVGKQVAEQVAGARPDAAPLVKEVATTGGSALLVRPDDPGALGATAAGAPVLALTEAASVLCLPLTLPSGQVCGVLTLLRADGRRPFQLAEASVLDRVSRHIALAVRGV
jgi:GAF domain-containing protein